MNIKVNVVNLQMQNKKMTISSLKKNGAEAVEGDTVKLVDVSNAATGMISAIWTIKDSKGIATCTVSPDNSAVKVVPKENAKGSIKITCEINGKKYTTNVKVTNK